MDEESLLVPCVMNTVNVKCFGRMDKALVQNMGKTRDELMQKGALHS